MKTLTDLVFELIDAGHEFGTTAQRVKKVPAGELVARSVQYAEKADAVSFRRAARKINGGNPRCPSRSYR